MNKTQSEIRQELAGTLERNRTIKWRWEHDPDKWGIQTLMAQQYKISKQAINQIIHNPHVVPCKSHYQGAHWIKIILTKLLTTLKKSAKSKSRE